MTERRQQRQQQRHHDFWQAEEDEYIDIWFLGLIRTIRALKLVSYETYQEIYHTSGIKLYDSLWRYKE